jgi:hypothetical protein
MVSEKMRQTHSQINHLLNLDNRSDEMLDRLNEELDEIEEKLKNEVYQGEEEEEKIGEGLRINRGLSDKKEVVDVGRAKYRDFHRL